LEAIYQCLRPFLPLPYDLKYSDNADARAGICHLFNLLHRRRDMELSEDPSGFCPRITAEKVKYQELLFEKKHISSMTSAEPSGVSLFSYTFCILTISRDGSLTLFKTSSRQTGQQRSYFLSVSLPLSLVGVRVALLTRHTSLFPHK
jgi:hypothetical protein